MLHGSEDRADPRRTRGHRTKVLMEDMAGANDAQLREGGGRAEARREADRAAVGAAQRPRRVSHSRTIEAEMQQLEADNPDRVKLFALQPPVAAGQADPRPRGQPRRRRRTREAGFLAGVRPRANGRRPSSRWVRSDLLMHDGSDPDATNLLEKGNWSRSGSSTRTATTSRAGCRTSGSARTAASRRRDPSPAQCTATANVESQHRPQPQLPAVLGRPGSSASATATNTRARPPAPSPRSRA